jgi:xanthine dehydrogenase YagR molybdenum-binding subunit
MSSAVGQAINRVDGRLKVTGSARYAGDYPGKEMAYGVAVQSTIGKGKVL